MSEKPMALVRPPPLLLLLAGVAWAEPSAAREPALEAEPPGLDAMPNVGQIMLACALGYRDLRFAGGWRAEHPRLVAWLDRFAACVPDYAATAVAG